MNCLKQLVGGGGGGGVHVPFKERATFAVKQVLNYVCVTFQG